MTCFNCGAAVEKPNPKTQRHFCGMACYGQWQRGRAFAEQGKKCRPERKCGAEGCEQKHFGRGFCRVHYIAAFYPSRPKPKVHAGACVHCGGPNFNRHKGAKYCSMACAAENRKKPFILKKGYKKLLIPHHPRADKKGYVFEHIVVAEAAIGRALRAGEEVHHVDFNRANNHPSNLEVCASHAEHMKRHHARPA